MGLACAPSSNCCDTGSFINSLNSSTKAGSLKVSPADEDEDEGISAAAPLVGFLQRSDMLPPCPRLMRRDFFPTTEKGDVDVEQSARSKREAGEMRLRPSKGSVSPLRGGKLLILLFVLAEKSESDIEPSTREGKSESPPDRVVGNNTADWSNGKRS